MTPAPSRRAFLLQSAGTALLGGAPPRPNVVVFYVDDMGYGQPGCYGGKLAPTPHMDAIAASGARFTNGYISACVCTPSRVGLVTGRYQARTGHDANTGRPGTELDAGETTIAQYMKRAGYATAITGKWHLGATPGYLPAARGFDVSMGTVSNLGEGGFYRGTELLDTLPGAPVTTPIYTREALAFIEKNRAHPFFLYLPFNDVHAPHVAPEEWLRKFDHLPQRDRAYAAQIAAVDAGIGAVMSRLRALQLEENTLVFCISDNGGPGAQADRGGLRGAKWNLFEGGIRVPFLVQWKGRIAPGQVRHEPVIQLDVLPTALAAAGADVRPAKPLDGVNLLPLLEGKAPPTREALYWRFGSQYAVRQGDWKLVRPGGVERPMLFHLGRDREEKRDLAAAEPARARELQALWDKWNAEMRPPRWVDRRWDDDEFRSNRQKRGKKK